MAITRSCHVCLPFVLNEPAANAWIGEITDAGIEFVVVGWIDQTATSMTLARGEALRLVKRAIEASGVAAPDRSDIAAVSAEAEGALDRMIDAEREISEGEDLLRIDAAKE